MLSLIDRFNDYLEQIDRIEDKTGFREHLQSIGYFTAPASTNHHLAKEGGLLEHSLNVTDTAIKIHDSLYDIGDTESIVICGLFHDLGKCDYYIPNELKSGEISKAKPYKTNPNVFMEHQDLSIIMLMPYIDLTDEEMFAIKYHNGLYTPDGYTTKGKEQPLQQIIHFADMWASRFIEKNNNDEGGNAEWLTN